VWIELAIAGFSAIVGILISILLTFSQISESRIAMLKLNNFLQDWRSESNVRLAQILETLRERPRA
jgi:hypothetical protein